MMHKRKVAGAALLSALFALRVQAQTQRPPLIGARVATEILAGTFAVPLGAGLGYSLGSEINSDYGPTVGFGLGALLGPAVAVHAAAGPSKGELRATTLGTAAGYATGFALAPAISKIPWSAIRRPLTVVSFLLPAIGATIGYNSTRR